MRNVFKNFAKIFPKNQKRRFQELDFSKEQTIFQISVSGRVCAKCRDPVKSTTTEEMFAIKEFISSVANTRCRPTHEFATQT